MFPKNCIIPGARSPVRNTRSSATHDARAAAVVNHAGRTIGPSGNSQQMTPPSQGPSVEASEQQQRFVNATPSGAAGSQFQSTNSSTTEAT